MTAAKASAAALHVGNIGPIGAVAERNGLLVDHAHVAGPIMREATGRGQGHLSEQKLLVFSLFFRRAHRRLRRARGAGREHCTRQQDRDRTHFDLLGFLLAPETTYSAPAHERKLSLSFLRRANSRTSVARTKGLVSRSCATVVGTVIFPSSRSCLTAFSRSSIARFSGSACT